MSNVRLNELRLKTADLRAFMRIGIDHIYRGAVNRQRGCLPFVRFNLLESPTWARHESWGSPHMIGRFLDGLGTCAQVMDIDTDEEVVRGLQKYLFDSLDNSWNLPFDLGPDPETGKKVAAMHHCREVLLGLMALFTWQGCERAKETAHAFVRTLEKVTRERGTFPAGTLYEDGWASPKPDELNTTSGRLIGALVKYYRATGDELAIDLARRFADINIRETFTSEGELTDLSGGHLHSTEGTMTSLLDLGVVTGEKRYGELGHLLYDRGLRPWRSSFGWAKEWKSDELGRGEANNTGDFIEAALILGLQGRGEYFRDVELFIRNGLLASQLLNTDWIAQSQEPDTNDVVYSRLRERSYGAFVFTTPNGYHSYNTDLMGGALQSLAEACRAIITRDKNESHINLLFTYENKDLALRSWLPESGKIQIDVRKETDLRIHLPKWVSPSTLKLLINGVDRPVTLKDRLLSIDSCTPNTQIEVSFVQTEYRTSELVAGWGNYDIDWRGDTIVAMTSNAKEVQRLY